MRKRHESEARDEHGNTRERMRRMHARHEEETKQLGQQQEQEMQQEMQAQEQAGGALAGAGGGAGGGEAPPAEAA
jgi:hypothetical protein